ncbi:GFA family protein [Cypionkella sp.]|uniref:GFA family protein n=1 Tax=Cypionkella sp. TaxID=2811411 RepID=UPI002AB8E99F|nr:GFA family protein [Cypionkella sp.]MDZ4395518.1 GFA family protein [Cypionkella sp.]
MQKTYHGSCHCGAVRFAAELDLAARTIRCNCSDCRKLRNWSARTTPEQFRLEKGALDLGSYVFAEGSGIDHAFCRHCGLTLFVRGDIAELGGAFVSVMVSVLEDATEAELIASPITWCDGLHNNWWNPPAEVRHL